MLGNQKATGGHRRIDRVSSVTPLHASMAGKLERIDQLADHGLNTPRILLIEVGSTFDAKLRKRMYDLAAGDPLMTVRTYHPTDEITFAKGPFAPEIPVDEAIRLAEELSNEWNVLFQEAIDVHGTALAGNIAVDLKGTGYYEALAGSYRVRDVEDPPPGAGSALRWGAFESPSDISDKRIRDAVELVLRSGLLGDVSEARGRLLLEFNVQREPVGRRREPLLFWEWRPLPAPANGSSRVRRPSDHVSAGGVFGVGVDGFAPVDSATSLEATLGGKGAGLAVAFAAGLPVPPFVVLSTPEVASGRQRAEAWSRDISGAIGALIEAANGFFGDSGGRRLAVRSSPSTSMPGMLNTVLNVDPVADSVERAIELVLDSWSADHAREYRRAQNIAESGGLAVILQPMVDATDGGRSGSGVGFTRHPATGAVGPEIEFVEREPGTSLVSGEALPVATAGMKSRWPDVFEELVDWCPVLERVSGDMQEFEFAIEDGRVCLLQTRRAKRTPSAALRVSHDLFQSGILDMQQAAALVDFSDTAHLVERHLATATATPIGTGRVASPGIAVGRVAFDSAGVERILHAGDDVVLLTTVPSPDDYPLVRRATAVISSRGGITSHASVVALDAGIVAVVGCRELEVERAERVARFGGTVVGEGDWLSIDAAERGDVFLGRLGEESPSLPADLSPELVSWARALARSR
jgi:phosphohistidine swiveling domain-containing protein